MILLENQILVKNAGLAYIVDIVEAQNITIAILSVVGLKFSMKFTRDFFVMIAKPDQRVVFDLKNYLSL